MLNLTIHQKKTPKLFTTDVQIIGQNTTASVNYSMFITNDVNEYKTLKNET